MGGLAHQPPDSFPLHPPTRVENSEAVKEATVHRDSVEHLKIAKEKARVKASPQEKYICCLQHRDSGEHLTIAKEKARVKASPREKYICCLQHIRYALQNKYGKEIYATHIYSIEDKGVCNIHTRLAGHLYEALPIPPALHDGARESQGPPMEAPCSTANTLQLSPGVCHLHMQPAGHL
jgi:hypothetical protein